MNAPGRLRVPAGVPYKSCARHSQEWTSEQEDGVDYKIELIPLAVRDVDRSVDFYGKELGWNVDHDQTVSPQLRFVQFIQVVVADADEALSDLRGRGVECSGVDEQPWGRFVRFDDPDGNRWALQQIVRPS
jgi:catechol 2,3-dioxygenase-like lactoylglutathione lyase family enzyme